MGGRVLKSPLFISMVPPPFHPLGLSLLLFNAEITPLLSNDTLIYKKFISVCMSNLCLCQCTWNQLGIEV